MKSTSPKLNLHAGLTIGYRTPIATVGEEISLQEGTHFLIARNGRGKTTLLRTIARSLSKIGGTFDSEGRIQFLPEDLRFDPETRVRSIFRALISSRRRDEAFKLAASLELDVQKDYGKLSTGNRRKVHLIVAEMSVEPGQPNILLMDEPFSGLDAHSREIFETLWSDEASHVLRLVSCHPDYDSMGMPSALIIQDESIRHTSGSAQTWNQLKTQLN